MTNAKIHNLINMTENDRDFAEEFVRCAEEQRDGLWAVIDQSRYLIDVKLHLFKGNYAHEISVWALPEEFPISPRIEISDIDWSDYDCVECYVVINDKVAAAALYAERIAALDTLIFAI